MLVLKGKKKSHPTLLLFPVDKWIFRKAFYMFYIFPRIVNSQNLSYLNLQQPHQWSYQLPKSELRGFACVSHKVIEISHIL